MTRTSILQKKSKIKKEDWLAKAMSILALKGISGVRIETIARELHVSKGGFYWHFKNRAELFNELLEVWRNEATTWFLERLEAKHPDPLDRLETLWVVAHSPRHDKPGGRLELSIRAWALDSEIAAKVVKSADRERMAFVRKLFEAIGFTADQAQIRAELFYGYINGRHLSSVQGSAADLKQQFEFLISK